MPLPLVAVSLASSYHGIPRSTADADLVAASRRDWTGSALTPRVPSRAIENPPLPNLGCEEWTVLEDLFDGRPLGDQGHDVAGSDPHAADTRSAAHDPAVKC